MTDDSSLSICLWFDDNAEEAVDFYTAIFPASRILAVTRYGESVPDKAGAVLTIEFELDGRTFLALNGGPQFTFNEAASIVVKCDSQAEIDETWDRLLAGGGTPVKCGWLKDRFGLFWQVVPREIGKLLAGGDAESADRVFQALMPMVKLDVAALQAAYHGTRP
jgi:predicted 3-demethylubiquinone-9 3-methyltransferase (glyoxalase superfamily)